jgi:hypothetical protein
VVVELEETVVLLEETTVAELDVDTEEEDELVAVLDEELLTLLLEAEVVEVEMVAVFEDCEEIMKLLAEDPSEIERDGNGGTQLLRSNVNRMVV